MESTQTSARNSQYHVLFFKQVWRSFILLFLTAEGLHWGAVGIVGQGMEDPSSPTRDQTLSPALEGRLFNHWTTSEIPLSSIIMTTIIAITLITISN